MVWLPLTAVAQPEAPASTRPSRLLILLRSVQIGAEETSVTRTSEGWTIASNGRIGPPLEITTRRLEVKYDAQWRPLELTVEAIQGTQPTTLHTVVTGESARNEFTNNVAPGERTDTIAADAILLPNPFFAPYEALSARLRTAAPGTAIQLYTAPLGTVTAVVGESTAERIQTVERLIEVRRTRIQFQQPNAAALDAEIWADEQGRLLRLRVPAQLLEVVREDIRSVSTRRVTVSRENDEQVRIPANGFTLAGTLSKPAGASGPLPAVILVAGSGPADRDEMVFDIPIFGQVAGTLADAGYVVLRYDKRGVGQSGGRPESATLPDYAEDLRAAVRFMAKRKDVDSKRLAVLGHSEGGSVAMLAAAADDRIRALVLVAALGVTGAELNMAQVTRAMARSSRPETEKEATLDLQRRIQTAVLTGEGWDTIPPAVRRQADVPWFSSFLSFDPAKPMSRIRQPMLIVQGELDTQVDPSNASRLEELAKARKRQSPVEVVRVPGVNHLLVAAKTGEVDEYASLPDRTISPAVTRPILDWLKKTFAAIK
ncbi:MAG: alpha/beta hydrolase family protein, partial [Vicinamibacterales bacterium]